jgi:hypothetical protein
MLEIIDFSSKVIFNPVWIKDHRLSYCCGDGRRIMGLTTSALKSCILSSDSN